MAATITQRDILNNEAAQFALYLRAYKECSAEVQQIVDNMSAIITNPESDDDERREAIDLVVEAMFPGLTTEIRERLDHAVDSEEGRAIEAALDAQEATFAERVRDLMQARGVTQAELADAAGVTQPAISNILTRNCRPQRRTVEKIAQAFSVTADELWPALS